MSDQDTHIAGMPGRYASALFELALDTKSLDQTAAELSQIQSMIDASTDFHRLVHSPVFTADEQANAVMAVLKQADISGLTANFVGLITKNRRLFAISGMIKAFHALLARHRGEVSAEVSSARNLNDKQTKALETALKSAIGRDVNLDTKVDPGLIGGIVVKVGSRMIDNSLKSKLDNLKIAMKEVG